MAIFFRLRNTGVHSFQRRGRVVSSHQRRGDPLPPKSCTAPQFHELNPYGKVSNWYRNNHIDAPHPCLSNQHGSTSSKARLSKEPAATSKCRNHCKTMVEHFILYTNPHPTEPSQKSGSHGAIRKQPLGPRKSARLQEIERLGRRGLSGLARGLPGFAGLAQSSWLWLSRWVKESDRTAAPSGPSAAERWPVAPIAISRPRRSLTRPLRWTRALR